MSSARGIHNPFDSTNEPGLLGVRGYKGPSEPGCTVLAAGLHFRAPLWWVERGIGKSPSATRRSPVPLTFYHLPEARSTLTPGRSHSDVGLGSATSVTGRRRMRGQ